MSVEIRPLTALEELHACEELQKRIWGFQEIAVVPHHLLLTARENGGVLLGAFEGKEMIGFVFGFPGLDPVQRLWKHCSLMCGVLSDRRFRGVGYQLKLAQREAVLAQGLRLVTWTFDPLQSANAYFNFHKLGVIARSYERNLYGDMRDGLNRGLPTDRFTVEWWIRSPRVAARVERGRRPSPQQIEATPVVNRTETRDGVLVNVAIDLDMDAERLLVEIPLDLQALKDQSLELARRWRLETRQIFEHYLARGYVVSEFTVTGERGGERGFYLLERTEPEELLKRAP
jgi:predicted GNAT superfamily acetyltransferase